MGLPLIILSGVTIVLGFLEMPLREFLLGDKAALPNGGLLWLPYLSVGLAVAGVSLAWSEFGRRTATQIGFVERIAPLKDLFAQNWYLDHLYRKLVDIVIDGIFSRGCSKNEDKVINKGIDGFSRLTLGSGRLFSLLQSGKFRYNLIVMFGALALVALYFCLAETCEYQSFDANFKESRSLITVVETKRRVVISDPCRFQSVFQRVRDTLFFSG
jgi:NADH-quinone oxidoreductase subunit L